MKNTLLSLTAMACLSGTLPCAAADSLPEGCAGFSWDISRELSVMRDVAVQLKATGKGSSLSAVEAGRHYAVQLLPQDELQFVVSPERPARAASPRGAVLKFRTGKGGRYRIALSSS